MVLAAAALSLGGVAGCAEQNVHAGLETPKRIEVERVPHRFDLADLDGTPGDWREEKGRLKAFTAAVARLPNRQGVLYLPTVMNARQEARAEAALAAIRETGFDLLIGELRRGKPYLDVRTVVANVPDCPDYSRQRIGHDNGPGSNFGCATQINLAAMVVDPDDLDRPRPAGPPRGEGAWRGVEQYRTGQRKELDGEEVLE